MASEDTRLYAYYVFVLALSLSAFYVFHRITSEHPADYLFLEKCVLCLVSSFFNLFVLWFHYTNAPHPKFVILPQRKLSIYTHIFSGVTEFVTCWAAFWTGSPTIGRIASLAALLGHVPSSYYQTSIVFGAKALMVAGYLFAISLHLFSALHLFFEPSSTYWLLNMFLVHNIYVWCRVFYGFFNFVGLFKSTVYTSSICFSGLLLFPAILGITGNMLFIGYVVVCIFMYLLVVRPNEAQKELYVRERTRELLVDKELYQNWVKAQDRLANNKKGAPRTEEEHARQVFDLLDADKSGYIDGEEVTTLLQQWKVADSFLKKFASKDKISFEEFYKYIWRLGENSFEKHKRQKVSNDEEKARFIFDCLDADKSGYIDAIELQKLLIQWGLPENEVDAYLATDDDKRYSFDEFHHQMKAIWAFAYENMGQASEPGVEPVATSKGKKGKRE